MPWTGSGHRATEMPTLNDFKNKPVPLRCLGGPATGYMDDDGDLVIEDVDIEKERLIHSMAPDNTGDCLGLMVLWGDEHRTLGVEGALKYGSTKTDLGEFIPSIGARILLMLHFADTVLLAEEPDKEWDGKVEDDGTLSYESNSSIDWYFDLFSHMQEKNARFIAEFLDLKIVWTAYLLRFGADLWPEDYVLIGDKLDTGYFGELARAGNFGTGEPGREKLLYAATHADPWSKAYVLDNYVVPDEDAMAIFDSLDLSTPGGKQIAETMIARNYAFWYTVAGTQGMYERAKKAPSADIVEALHSKIERQAALTNKEFTEAMSSLLLRRAQVLKEKGMW